MGDCARRPRQRASTPRCAVRLVRTVRHGRGRPSECQGHIASTAAARPLSHEPERITMTVSNDGREAANEYSHVLLVTGARTWTDEALMRDTFQDAWRRWGPQTVRRPLLVAGHCPSGADAMAEQLWRDQGFAVRTLPADWRPTVAAPASYATRPWSTSWRRYWEINKIPGRTEPPPNPVSFRHPPRTRPAQPAVAAGLPAGQPFPPPTKAPRQDPAPAPPSKRPTAPPPRRWTAY